MAARLFPTWAPPAERERALLEHLSRVADMVAARGKQKHKRLLAFTQVRGGRAVCSWCELVCRGCTGWVDS